MCTLAQEFLKRDFKESSQRELANIVGKLSKPEGLITLKDAHEQIIEIGLAEITNCTSFVLASCPDDGDCEDPRGNSIPL